MRKKLFVAELGLLALLAACADAPMQAQRSSGPADMVQDAPGGKPDGTTHMRPVWDDPEFIKG